MAGFTCIRSVVALLVAFVVSYHLFYRATTSTAGPLLSSLLPASDAESSTYSTTVIDFTSVTPTPIPHPDETHTPTSHPHQGLNDNGYENIEASTGPPAMGIVSMLYGENEWSRLYERALDSHVRHAKRWNYPVYILRQDVFEGVWSKLAYLLHVLVLEMEKEASKRTKWLMWFDADSILINPALPLDIFTPPADFADIHFLATKDQNGFNAGMFFIRVHPKSIRLISKALAFPQYNPDYDLSYIEQTAIYRVLNETEFRSHVLYQPRIWYNTYEFHHGYEGQKGDILAHFPGLEDDRGKHMQKWLDVIEGPEQADWEVPLSETRYPGEVDNFWALLRYGIQTMEAVRDKYREFDKIPSDLKAVVKRLEAILWNETDQIEVISAAIQDVQKMLDSEQKAELRGYKAR